MATNIKIERGYFDKLSTGDADCYDKNRLVSRKARNERKVFKIAEGKNHE